LYPARPNAQAGRAVLETFSPSVQTRAKSRIRVAGRPSRFSHTSGAAPAEEDEPDSASDGSSGESGGGPAEEEAGAVEEEEEEAAAAEEEDEAAMEEEEEGEGEEEAVLEEEEEEEEEEQVLPASHQKLLQELTMQIDIQEKLLDELNLKENELVKQRQLYEKKLSDAKKERVGRSILPTISTAV